MLISLGPSPGTPLDTPLEVRKPRAQHLRRTVHWVAAVVGEGREVFSQEPRVLGEVLAHRCLQEERPPHPMLKAS